MRHGTNTCYQMGCRLPECRVAHKVAHAKWQRLRTEGPVLVDARSAKAAAAYAIEAGITWRAITERARMTGRSRNDLTDLMRRDRRVRMLEALDALLDEQQERLDDARSALKAATTTATPDVYWPTEPLRTAIERRWGGLASSPMTEADRRYLYRSATVDEQRAERLCRECDLDPENIWPSWFGYEEAS